MNELLKPIEAYLQSPTPQNWIDEAIKPEKFATLIIDHGNCELKAAQTTILLIRKYAVDSHSSEHLLTV